MHAKVEQVVSGAPFCHFIGGEFVGSAGGGMFDTLNPATGEVYAQVHEAGREEVDAAVEAARLRREALRDSVIRDIGRRAVSPSIGEMSVATH